MTKKKILTESLALEDAPKQQSVKEEPVKESIEENVGEVLEKEPKRPPLDKPNQPEKTQLPPKKKTMVTFHTLSGKTCWRRRTNTITH